MSMFKAIKMKKSIYLFSVISLLVAYALLVQFAQPASAHAMNASEKIHDDKKPDAQVKDILYYEFITPRDCSLTLLTRRALQIYDAQNDAIGLSPAQTIFAETSIVQKLGSRYLEIGEHVKIDKDLVEDFSYKSQELSLASLEAWNVYAKQASFDLGYITTIGTSSTNTDVPSGALDLEPLDSKQVLDAKEHSSSRKGPSFTSWLAGIIGLTSLYYLLRTPPKR